jgi:preprotein translocase subunit SecE
MGRSRIAKQAMGEAKLESEVTGKAAKPRIAVAGNALAGIGSWPGRTKAFLAEVRTETKRVTWPNLNQVWATTIVVLVTVFFFGVYFGILDWVFNYVVRRLLRFGA